MATDTSVEDWLRSLGLVTYSEAFLDNGYDNLDICKLIGDEDLDAIGVINSKDRRDILQSVNLLKEKGAHAIYFLLEQGNTTNASPPQSDREKYRREVLIDRMKDLLAEDNCVLTNQTAKYGEHDPLDGLAQYYADQLYTYIQDVKDVLEYLRDGESNEGLNDSPHSSLKSQKKKNVNSKLAEDSRLSKSLNSLDSAFVKGKSQKSPKHGIGRLFSGKKKNYVQQPPKISGPMETAILASQVQMSEDDRKSLMLQVKHGDMTQDEALNNFLRYEANHTSFSTDQDKSLEKKKKKGGFFNRSSFKRHSSGNSSEVLASNIAMGEKDRMELMRKIKTGEITTEEAWDHLRRFGSKRDSKSKSPKAGRHSKSSKSRDRISASSVHLTSTFYTGVNSEISQSTSNIPSRTASTDSSPDSTPGLSRKLDLQQGHANSAEQLRSSGSFEFMDTKGNYNKPRPAAPPIPARTPSPLTQSDLRRSSSERNSGSPREIAESSNQHNTLSDFRFAEGDRRFSSSGEKYSVDTCMNGRAGSDDARDVSPPVPKRKPPQLPPNKPVFSQHHDNRNVTQDNTVEIREASKQSQQDSQKPKIPSRPVVPAKPVSLRNKPLAKPQNLQAAEKSTDNQNKSNKSGTKGEGKIPLISLANGTAFHSHDDSDHFGSLKEKVQKRKPRVPPSRPSPLTRVSRHKPSGLELLEMIEAKLKGEGIDLLREPYTGQDGKWGVPMTLIDRYSCELHSTMREVTKEVDHIRIERLNHAKRTATPCDLTHLRFAPDVVGELSSMAAWLTSLGLPMYIDNLTDAGYDDVHEIPYLSEEHLDYANITNPDHKKRLIRSLENMSPNYESQSSFEE